MSPEIGNKKRYLRNEENLSPAQGRNYRLLTNTLIMTDVLLYSRGEPQPVSYTGGDRERPEEDRVTWSYNIKNATSSRSISRLTKDFPHVIEFP